MSESSEPPFLREPHDVRDPSPWLAIYLDQSIPMAEECRRVWLVDLSSKSRYSVDDSAHQ